MRVIPLLCLLWLPLLTGCARHAITTWGYSAWYRVGGASEMGPFKRQREACLEQSGIAPDGSGVEPNSEAEHSFLNCMNGHGWCTEEFGCGGA